MPPEAVGDDVEHPPGVVHVIRVGRGDRFPGVADGVSCRDTEGVQEPLLAVGAVAFSYDRKTGGSLLSHAALDQLLSDRYPDERLADEFHQRYQDTQTALRRKAHADS